MENVSVALEVPLSVDVVWKAGVSQRNAPFGK